MRPAENTPLPGEIFEDYAVLSVGDLSRLCAAEPHTIVELVELGVLRVIEVEGPEWRFGGGALRRARTALRLHRDLEINLPGVALALELLDELNQLRRELGERRP
jgi:chaperone modulatory protein CbpM